MLALKPITNRNQWEKFLLVSDQANFLHSWAWGQMHQKLGQKVFYYGIFDNQQLTGLLQLIKVTAKRAVYLECSGGPVFDWSLAAAGRLVRQMKQIAKDNHASFIRIRPNIYATKENLNLVKKLGFRKAPMHLHAESTWVLPLTADLAVIFKNMRKTTRYLIKKAESMGVEIRQSTEVKKIETLYRLQQETVKRKHFTPFAKDYFAAELASFLPDNARIFSAVYQGKTLAVALILFYGEEAVYHYSGSSNLYREVPASYLLQWAVIKAAKERGLKRYNFWGFTANPKHRFYGPSLFKQGFGGEAIDYLPAHDLVTAPGYWLNFAVETWRRKWRRL